MKRLYEDAAVWAVEGGVAVTLDGKTVNTPAKRPLVLPNELVAKVIAGEWSKQGETIEPDKMPLMRLAATAIDMVADNRDAVVDEIASYGETDYICYRSAVPQDLNQREAEAWDPLLDWCADRFGARLAVTDGMVAIKQDSAATQALRAVVDGYDDFSLAALNTITTATGSLVLALALADKRIDAHTAWMLSRVDEMFQAQRWGMDQEARDNTELMRQTLFASSRFLRLCNHGKIAGERGRP